MKERRKQQIPLTVLDVEILLVMHDSAPATVELVEEEYGIKRGPYYTLIELMKMGLVCREQVGGRGPPHVYDLTERGKIIGHHLSAIRSQMTKEDR